MTRLCSEFCDLFHWKNYFECHFLEGIRAQSQSDFLLDPPRTYHKYPGVVNLLSESDWLIDWDFSETNLFLAMSDHTVQCLHPKWKIFCLPKYSSSFSIFQVNMIIHETPPYELWITGIPILGYEYGSLKIKLFC